jgi:hypothetical protein
VCLVLTARARAQRATLPAQARPVVAAVRAPAPTHGCAPRTSCAPLRFKCVWRWRPAAQGACLLFWPARARPGVAGVRARVGWGSGWPRARAPSRAWRRLPPAAGAVLALLCRCRRSAALAVRLARQGPRRFAPARRVAPRSPAYPSGAGVSSVVCGAVAACAPASQPCARMYARTSACVGVCAMCAVRSGMRLAAWSHAPKKA